MILLGMVIIMDVQLDLKIGRILARVKWTMVKSGCTRRA